MSTQKNRSGTLQRLAVTAFVLDPDDLGEATARFIYYGFEVEPHPEMIDDCGPTAFFTVSTLSRLDVKHFRDQVLNIINELHGGGDVYEWWVKDEMNDSLAAETQRGRSS